MPLSSLWDSNKKQRHCGVRWLSVVLRVLSEGSFLSFSRAVLTTTGRSMATKQQNLCLSSMRAFLRACFSVSSSRMYLSLTSCMALSNWGWISPRPWKQNGHTNTDKKECIHYYRYNKIINSQGNTWLVYLTLLTLLLLLYMLSFNCRHCYLQW